MDWLEQIRSDNAAARVPCLKCGEERQSHVSITTSFGAAVWICPSVIYVPVQSFAVDGGSDKPSEAAEPSEGGSTNASKNSSW